MKFIGARRFDYPTFNNNKTNKQNWKWQVDSPSSHRVHRRCDPSDRRARVFGFWREFWTLSQRTRVTKALINLNFLLCRLLLLLLFVDAVLPICLQHGEKTKSSGYRSLKKFTLIRLSIQNVERVSSFVILLLSCGSLEFFLTLKSTCCCSRRDVHRSWHWNVNDEML